METVLRVLLIYIFILLGLRVMGKREFSQLSPLELVTILLIPELVSQAVVREDFSFTNGIIAVSTIFSLVFISSVLQHHSKTFSKIVSSSPTVLVANGELIQKHLNQERISPQEIFSEMHKVGLADPSQVKWAILESDGRISIVLQDTEQMAPVQQPDQRRVT